VSGNPWVARLLGVNSEMADFARTASNAVGAVTAFEELYEANRTAVVRFLMAFAGSEDRAVDLASQTFAQAWSECRRGRTIGLGWLLRTARNAAIDASRRDAVRRRFSRSERRAGNEPSAEDIVIRLDSAATLRAGVARLPSPQREAVVLRFTTDLPVREIAAVIGKREDATEKLIARAIRKLREDFDDQR
jgi:RNA polymerase sigma-70 factor (ECF subfamily)